MEFLTPPDNVTSFASVQRQRKKANFGVAELIRPVDDITRQLDNLALGSSSSLRTCDTLHSVSLFVIDLSERASATTRRVSYLISKILQTFYFPPTTNGEHNGEKKTLLSANVCDV